MSSNQLELNLHPWGILSFDRAYRGLPSQTFNLLRYVNKEIGYAAVGHFIKAGLDIGERIAIVTFDNPKYMLEKFQEYGFSFDKSLAAEQLMYFYYKSRFSYALSFSSSYGKMYEELESLSNVGLDRIVFLYADVLFNLETHLLAKQSAERISASFGKRNTVILGCYQAAHFRTHNILDEISHESLVSYLELAKSTHGDNSRYDLIVRRFPMHEESCVLNLQLSEKLGLNTPVIGLVNHG